MAAGKPPLRGTHSWERPACRREPRGASLLGLTLASGSGDAARVPGLRKVYSKGELDIATFTVGPPLKFHFKWEERKARKEIKFFSRPK